MDLRKYAECEYPYHANLAGPDYACPNCGQPEPIDDTRNVVDFEFFRALRGKNVQSTSTRQTSTSAFERLKAWLFGQRRK